MMRLDKYLSDCGFGTRKEIKKIIKNEEVLVNGVRILSPSTLIQETDEVIVNNEVIHYQEFIYIILNKPGGYISATEGNEPNVLDLIQEYYKGLFPVGRLDKDTEGLLLITNDGQLAHQLLSPKKHVEKEYIAKVDDALTEEEIERFKNGLEIDGYKCQDADIFLSNPFEYHVIIHEGKFHQIKRMFKALDKNVLYLKRIRMKNLLLDDSLEVGQYRYLTEEEIEDLKV